MLSDNAARPHSLDVTVGAAASVAAVVLDWIAADRTAWQLEMLPERIVLQSGSETIDLPKDRWKSDLYIAPHGDAVIVRVETFQRAVGFLITSSQVEPLLRHLAQPAVPVATSREPSPGEGSPLIWPRVSSLSVWAVICSSLAFLPVVGLLPAIAAIILLILHRRRVRRSAALGHSRLLCMVAAVLVGGGLSVSALSTWGIVDNFRDSSIPVPPPALELSNPRRSSMQASNDHRMDDSSFRHAKPTHAQLSRTVRYREETALLFTTPCGAARDLPIRVPQPHTDVLRAGVLDEDRNWGLIAAALFVVLLSLTVHEAAHAISAWWLGDDFARRLGRVTLNPAAHVDPIGTVLLPLILFLAGAGVFGWAKPVPVRLDHVSRPRRAQILIALAGPGSNLLLAAVSLMLLLGIACVVGRLAPTATIDNLIDLDFHTNVSAGGFLLAPVFGPLCTILKLSILINVMLAFFNLIPIPPLDGSWVLENLFPFTLGPIYQRIRPMSFLLFLGLLYSNVLDRLLLPAWYVLDFSFALLSICTAF